MPNFLSGVSRALVLAAHTDDEFGCAGLMARLRSHGAQVKYVAFSKCEESVPAGFPSDVLVGECLACTSRLGLSDDDVEIRDFKVRHFPRDRQAILEDMVQLNRAFRPELVLLPSSYDTHQDHATIYNEGFRAFKHATILGYELPQNLTSFAHSAFIELTPEQLTTKIEALNHYKSQASRSYAAEDFIRGLATVRGVQANAQYAEAFELIRLIVRL